MMVKRAFYGLLFALLGAGVWGSATAAGAATPASKPYSAVICPTEHKNCGPGVAGHVEDSLGNVQFTATLKNLAKEQSIGSANILAPDSFKLIEGSASANRSGVSVEVDTANGLVKVRNAAIAPNGTLKVMFGSDLTGAGGPWSFGVDARQSNNFGGEGNGFRLDASVSQLTTHVANSQGATCPEEAPDTTKPSCTMSVIYKGTGPRPEPASGAAAGEAGTNAFSALDADEPFTIRMDVTAFPIAPVNFGTLTVTLPAARNIACGGAAYSLPAVGRTTGPQNRRKEVRFTIDYTSALSGTPQPICFGAPYAFESNTAVATPTLQGPAPSDPQPLFVGVLLDCHKLTAPKEFTPCMRQRVTDTAGNWVILVDIPGTLPDPYYR